MGEGEDLLITRKLINEDGELVTLDKLTKDELLKYIKKFIRMAIHQEWVIEGKPGYYKNSWQTHLGNDRSYFDLCQVAFHKKIILESFIEETVKTEWDKLNKTPRAISRSQALKKFNAITGLAPMTPPDGIEPVDHDDFDMGIDDPIFDEAPQPDPEANPIPAIHNAWNTLGL